ncbi:hypothetical protein BT96DRAFT_534698 [Gymnopus androsaceus JB14]|uniref:BTB domain-containing protein n=1 Tax=Gymnopus androsaceus JB14 TaxID=1447944 RepID=A0A6A4IJE7_9AGAR|nr:hypothetical protein BT96DRAFT_534698 [Gymnopus androsaceus JB14]
MPSKVSAKFNASSGGDVIFQSSNSVLFYVHKDALGYNSGGFPNADMVTVDTEPVPLTESSEVLEILFQFVYPRRHPGLDEMDFSLFIALAEAAEKYEVYFAMNMCQSRMRDYLPRYAAEVFGFAGKHDYPHVIASVAPLLIGKPLTEVAHALPVHLFIPWSIYQQQWTNCLQKSMALHTVLPRCGWSPGNHEPLWYQKNLELQTHLSNNITRLQTPDILFQEIIARKALCKQCTQNFDKWKEAIQAEVQVQPDFLTFWKHYRSQT